MLKRLFLFIPAASLVSSLSAVPLSSTEFQASPSFTDNFAGGASTGKWEVDPGNAGGSAPQFVTSTPAGVNATVTTLNPVASSSDGGVMMVGNPTSTNGTLFGLDYVRCTNSLANGTGDDYATTVPSKMRVVARIYLFSSSDKSARWQVGPYLNGGADLFRPCAFYNTNATGGGPGFGWRGATVANGAISGTSAIATSGWRLMSVMMDATDPTPANWRLAIGVDANGNGIIDETDPLEYVALTLNSTRTPAPFGIFTVGEGNSDGFPVFVDSVQMYKPLATAGVPDWTLY